MIMESSLRITHMLCSLGKTEDALLREKLLREPSLSSIISKLPAKECIVRMSDDELASVIRGVCLVEGWERGNGVVFGSTTVIPALLAFFSGRDAVGSKTLADWLFARRANPYIPLGRCVDLSICSYAEYMRAERERVVRTKRKLEQDKKKARSARLEKQHRAQEHAARAKVADMRRSAHLARLKTLSPARRLFEISEGTHGAAYYPEAYARVSKKALADMTAEMRRKLLVRLRGAGARTEWGMLRRKLQE